ATRADGSRASASPATHATAARGLHDSGPRGIPGSGARGIHGSGARGIHGSGARGIHGSGARGIHGSGSRTFQAAVMGPVEAISQTDSTTTLTVLGQTFSVAQELVDGFSAGDYVVVSGSDGVAAVVYAVGQQYVPG